MQNKLTLRMDEKLIFRAKTFAQKTGKSVSQIVADYFMSLEGRGNDEDTPITPIVKSLKGSLKDSDVNVADYHRHLEKKYL